MNCTDCDWPADHVHYAPLVVCERCHTATTDPDLWDPEVNTGRTFCDTCWRHRNAEALR